MLKLIQLGLTLCDEQGNLPVCNGEQTVWQFNFRGFRLADDVYAQDSIELLKQSGIDFAQVGRPSARPHACLSACRQAQAAAVKVAAPKAGAPQLRLRPQPPVPAAWATQPAPAQPCQPCSRSGQAHCRSRQLVLWGRGEAHVPGCA
jgi:hypothetical protein